MSTTAVLLFELGGLLVLTLVSSIVLCRLGLAWVRSSNVTWRRLFKAMLLCEGFSLACTISFYYLESLLSDATMLATVGAAILVSIIVFQCAVAVRMFQVSKASSVLIFVIKQLGIAGILSAVVLLLTRPYLFQSFQSPFNSMAPTILGPHLIAQCPVCGSPAYCSAPEAAFISEDPVMICEKHFHMSGIAEFDKRQFPADRFLVAMYLKPQRWDIVLLQYPSDPSKLFIKRLIGFPGEEITIEDGTVFVNGQRLTPPQHLKGIQYLFNHSTQGSGSTIWGTPEHPAKLAADEYFVLGDFSKRSNDSRYWQHGAEGHNPYAVPASYIKGVVTHIYWPPQRMRIFR